MMKYLDDNLPYGTHETRPPYKEDFEVSENLMWQTALCSLPSRSLLQGPTCTLRASGGYM